MSTTWTESARLPPHDPTGDDVYVFECAGWLDGSDIASADVTSSDLTILSVAITNSNQNVSYRITAGVADTDATVSLTVTNDDAQPRIMKRSVKIAVKDL